MQKVDNIVHPKNSIRKQKQNNKIVELWKQT